MDGRATLAQAGWVARREMSRLSWRGMLGLGLLACAAVLGASALWPAREEAATLRSEFADLRSRLKATGTDASGRASPTRAAQLETFYGFFPGAASLPDWIGHVHVAALRQGLTLDKGEYRLSRPQGARLARYQMQLPVKGSYPQLRAFVAEVLQKVPAAAIEDVTVKRDTIGAPVLEAQVRLNLYLGAAP